MTRILAYLPTVIGTASIMAFMAFLFFGPFHLITFSLATLPLGNTGILLFDAGLCLMFFLQHSIMLRKGFKGWITQKMPKRYFGAFFALSAAGGLFAFVSLWQESTWMIAQADGIFRWSLQGIFIACLIAQQAWIDRALKSSVDVFGTNALLQSADAPPAPKGPILSSGPYGWVRHPTYTTILLMIWAYPDLTADRLLLNCLFTAWLFIGTVLEERDLVVAFGEEYRTYQKKVPMLIPYRIPGGPFHLIFRVGQNEK